MDIFFVNSNIFNNTEIEWIIQNFGNDYKSLKRLKEYALGRFVVKSIGMCGQLFYDGYWGAY